MEPDENPTEPKRKWEPIKTSEWQDVLGQFQHISEAEVFCENIFYRMQAPNAYPLIQEYLFACRAFFRRFQNICGKTEKEEFEKLFEDGMLLNEKIQRKAQNLRLSSPGMGIILSRMELLQLEKILSFVCDKREEKGLGLRVHISRSSAERMRNAIPK